MSSVNFAIPDFGSLIPNAPTEGAPSLRSLQGWAAMLPAQLLCVLRYQK